MSDSHDNCVIDSTNAPATLESNLPQQAAPAAALMAAALLSACGGGGGGSPATPGTPVPVPPVVPPPPPTPVAPTAVQASRFLGQASMGATRDDIAKVQSLGYAGWLDQQFALPASGTRWDWLIDNGYGAVANKNSEAGADAGQWRKLLSAPDTLRQRVTLALSEIVVAAVTGFVGS